MGSEGPHTNLEALQKLGVARLVLRGAVAWAREAKWRRCRVVPPRRFVGRVGPAHAAAKGRWEGPGKMLSVGKGSAWDGGEGVHVHAWWLTLSVGRRRQSTRRVRFPYRIGVSVRPLSGAAGRVETGEGA